MPSLAQLRAELARAERLGDRERADHVRRDYYAAKLAGQITEVVAKAPPLYPEQIERLRALLGAA